MSEPTNPNSLYLYQALEINLEDKELDYAYKNIQIMATTYSTKQASNIIFWALKTYKIFLRGFFWPCFI